MDVDALINAAVNHLEAGDPESAEHICCGILHQDPSCGLAWINLSCACLQQGRVKEAHAAAQRGISLRPMDAVGWHNLGDCLLRIGDPRDGLLCYDRALVLDSGNARFWVGRGKALMTLNRRETAVLCFEHAIRMEPADADAQTNLNVGKLLADEHRKEALVFVLGLAASVVSGEMESEQARHCAMELVSTEQVDREMVRQFDSFVEINRNNPEFYHVAFRWLIAILAACLPEDDLAAEMEARFEEALKDQETEADNE